MSARPIQIVLLALTWQTLGLGVVAQEVSDYTALAEPAFANRLGLTDEQRAAVAKILDQRVQKLVAAEPDERPQVLAESNKMLEQLLSDEQQAAFAALVAGGKLRFNFRQQKWPDVLDWFARQGELSLVMDTSPPGLFTYNDTKEYTPVEAIDLLNSVLLSKGFTLMRREKMLIVVDTSQGIPFEMAARVSVEELASRGRFEIVTVEFPLGGRPIETCLAAVRELIGTHGRATPLTTAGKLIVTETSGKLQAINEVIAAIPVPKPVPTPAQPAKPPEPVFAVYPAKGLDPQATVETLQGLFITATIKADPRAEEIHAYAIPAVQESIKASVEKMVANVSGDKRVRLEIYTVGVKELAQLQSQLVLAVPDAQVTVDEAQGRLLVVANVEQQAEVQQTLEKLGAATEEAEHKAEVAIYPVDNESTASLVTLLTQVLPRSLVVSQPGRIAVRGTADEQKLARATIDQFEQSEPRTEQPALKFYPLDRPLDTSLLTAIQTAIPKATATMLDDGKRLSVFATAEDQALVEATLENIEINLPQPEKRTLAIYKSDRLSTAEFQTLLTSVVPAAKISADPSGSRLIVWGTVAEHESISSTLRRVGEEALPEKPLLETYEVPQSEAAAILAAAQALTPKSQSSLDSTNRRLIVIGSEQDQQFVRELVSKLMPTEEAARKVLIAYPLEQADPAAVVEMLQELRPDDRFAADVRANRVLVTAPLREQPNLQAIIEQLDAAPDVTQEEIVKPYPLRTLTPTLVVELLQPIVPKMRLSADEAAKQLLAAGTEFHHQKLEKALAKIDGEQAATAEVLSYDIAAADPEQVRNVLLQLVPTAVVSSNPAAQRLMVWAEQADHTAIKQAIDQFIRQEPGQTRQLRTYPLPKAIAAAALTMLQSVAPEAMLSLDASGEQIIAWATAKQQQAVEQAIQELEQNLPQREDVSLRVYPIEDRRLAAQTIVDSLDVELTEGVSIQINVGSNSLIVRATAAEHERLKQAITALAEQLPPPTSLNTQVFRFAHGSPSASLLVLQRLVPTANIAADELAGTLAATASDADLARIKAVVEQMQATDPEANFVTQIYRFNKVAANAARSTFLQLAPKARIAYDDNAKVVIATASEADQQLFRDAATQLDAQPTGSVTRVYPLKLASAAIVQKAVAPLVENGLVVGDEASGSLLVTGTDADHLRVAEVIDELDAVPSQQPVVRAYPVRNADADAVYQTVSQAYNGNRDVSVTFRPTTRSLFVVATPRHHTIFKELIEELDQAVPSQPKYAKVYSLANVDGEVASSALNALFKGRGAEVQFNATGNALVVVATAEQHQAVEESLKQMEGIERALEVFALQNTDPLVVENAVYELFADAPEAAAPSVSSDYDSQRLFVRGTMPQIEQIRKLLVSLGESVGDGDTADTSQSGDVRTIVFPGDTHEAVRQIEAIWTRLRPNRIQVITPAQRDLIPRLPLKTPDEPRTQDESSSDDENDATNKSSAVRTSRRFYFVATQQTTRKQEPEQAAEKNANSKDEPETPPVVVVPEDGRITISSPDHEALDQLESLLRAMARSDAATNAPLNFAVYMLQNTGAGDMQQLLERLFDELPFTRSSVGKVVVVADERLNALIVHGSRKDREVVEQLLQVLDTSESPSPLSVSQPDLLPLKNTQARRVLAILENVYKSQLTSGGGRKPVQIPKGVSSEVASVLQQLNAAAAGPLLTLDVDETTNSIVMRAPPELREEIKSFVEQLDEQASDRPNRGVRVIRLENSKADRMQAILEQFILQSP